MTPKFNLVEELRWRGMYYDATPGAEELVKKECVTCYVGFDPTADSLHIGSLATAMLLIHAQRAGHKPLALVGGATGMVGDPTGKSAERKLLTTDELQANLAGIQRQLEAMLDFGDIANRAEVVNNYDWIGPMSFIEFLRDVGKHLSVNYMMSKDSVQKRLEFGLSFTEFSYQLLQAYDFVHLYKHRNCKLQMGGSDQWGNITAGTELIRRMLGEAGSEAEAITGPLLTKADGTKFGKSEGGANIWLDPKRTSPYKFYQYLLNTGDADVEKLVKVFSLQSREAMEAALNQGKEKPEARIPQRFIAEELTARVHGTEGLRQAEAASEVLFGNAPVAMLEQMGPEAVADLFEGVPTGQFAKTRLEEGAPLLDLLVETQAFASKGEARKMIQGGGLRLNKEKVADEKLVVNDAALIAGRYLLFQKGKRNYHVVEVI